MELQKLVRKYFLKINDEGGLLTGVDCETDLSANENGLGSPLPKWYNRFRKNDDDLAAAIAGIKQIAAEQVFVAHGRSAVVSALLDCFCEPGSKDEVVICTPEDSSFIAAASRHGATVKEVPLADDFQLDLVHLENAAGANTKLVLISSPNSIAGNSLEREAIEALLNNFDGVVVVDEAHINFARQRSMVGELNDYENLVVLQNFNGAWGLAGLNICCAFASASITAFLKLSRPGSNISQAAATIALQAFEKIGQTNSMTREVVAMRVALKGVLEQMAIVEKVFPSDANFLLVKFFDGAAVHQHLLDHSVTTKKITSSSLNDVLRISIGNEQELTALVDALSAFSPSI